MVEEFEEMETRKSFGTWMDGVQMQRVTLLGKGMVVSLQDGATNRREW